MVATDLANYSEYALTWANEVQLVFLSSLFRIPILILYNFIQEIMDSGDELIILRVVTVDMTGE